MAYNIRCRNCLHYTAEWCEPVKDSTDPDILRNCRHYKVMTNEDKLKRMDVVGLSELLSHGCPPIEICMELHKDIDDELCKVCWLSWLKQESSDWAWI